MVITVLNQQNPNPMMCLAVLRCLYDTTRLTRIHSQYLVMQLKLVSVIQSLVDRNIDDKVNVSCMQILIELVKSGYHLQMIENSFLNSVLRMIQGTESSLYPMAIDLLRQLIQTSTYNST